jgi:hypothetical protein
MFHECRETVETTTETTTTAIENYIKTRTTVYWGKWRWMTAKSWCVFLFRCGCVVLIVVCFVLPQSVVLSSSMWCYFVLLMWYGFVFLYTCSVLFFSSVGCGFVLSSYYSVDCHLRMSFCPSLRVVVVLFSQRGVLLSSSTRCGFVLYVVWVCPVTYPCLQLVRCVIPCLAVQWIANTHLTV